MKTINVAKDSTNNKKFFSVLAGVMVLAVAASTLFLMAGCNSSSNTPADTTDAGTTDAGTTVADTTVADTTVADTTEAVTAAPVEVAPGEDEVPYEDLVWSYGGEKLPNAQLCDARIKDLVVTDDMMRYSWISGGCEDMGASNAHDHDNTLACLFVQGPDGVWRGGKFEWVSTDRLTRELKNIKKEPYKGWPKDIFDDAQGVAFVIVANNGKLRTNVIRAK